MFRNLRWAPLVAVLVLSACSDSGTNPLESGDFDPVATEQAVDELHNHLSDDSDIMVSLGLAAEALAGAGGGAPMRLDRAPDPLSARMVQSYSLVAGSAEPVIPPELLGRAFEWSESEGRYVLSDRTGVPGDRVRFFLYAIDPIMRVPVSPLAETGILDVIDEGDASTTRIRLYAESGGIPLVDYFLQFTYSVLGESDVAVTVSAEGYVSDGEDRLDFLLSQAATLLGSTNTLEMDVLYSLSLAGQNVSVTVQMTGEFDFSAENPIETASVDLRVQNGPEFVDFEMTLAADNSLTGVIKHNGTTAVNIAGTEADPVFTRADGEQLTAEEVAALVALFDIIEDVFDVAEELFEPFGSIGV